MRYRSLGTTGVKVSPLCLGAMMFGAFGNRDHDDCVTDHPRRARCRHQLRRHRRRVLRRRVGGDRRQGTGRSPRRRRARHEVPRWHGHRPEPPGQLAALDRQGGREQPAPTRHRPHRPVPGAPSRARHRHRRHAVRALRPRPPGQDPLPRLVDVPGRGDRRGAVGGREARPRAVPRASSRRTRSSLAASRRRCSRPARSTAWASSRGAR